MSCARHEHFTQQMRLCGVLFPKRSMEIGHHRASFPGHMGGGKESGNEVNLPPRPDYQPSCECGVSQFQHK